MTFWLVNVTQTYRGSRGCKRIESHLSRRSACEGGSITFSLVSMGDLSLVLLRFLRRFERNVTGDEFPQIQFRTGMINVDADEIAIHVVIQDDTLRNLDALGTGLGRKIDVKRVSIWMVI